LGKTLLSNPELLSFYWADSFINQQKPDIVSSSLELVSTITLGAFRLMSSESFQHTGSRLSDQQRSSSTERLKVSSGYVVVIDQFMLSNDQFITLLKNCGDISDLDESTPRLSKVVHSFGGSLLSVRPTDYLVHRDSEKAVIALMPLEDGPSDIETVMREHDKAVLRGRVFVDTRCVVFSDASILAQSDLLRRYQQIRRAGNEKRGRDMLRETGAAVRYGFQKHGDELGVFEIPELKSYALWPDVVE
jgi:hypothetical protein